MIAHPSLDVLVVNIDSFFSATLNPRLQAQGSTVGHAPAAFDALLVIAKALPDVVISGHSIPGGSGAELAALLHDRGIALLSPSSPAP